MWYAVEKLPSLPSHPKLLSEQESSSFPHISLQTKKLQLQNFSLEHQ
jgi:hypothetical protein